MRGANAKLRSRFLSMWYGCRLLFGVCFRGRRSRGIMVTFKCMSTPSLTSRLRLGVCLLGCDKLGLMVPFKDEKAESSICRRYFVHMPRAELSK